VRHDTGGAYSIFTVDPGATVGLSGLTISNALVLGSGGGIFNRGTLTVSNSTVASNLAREQGGGIWNDGTLTVSHSTIASNGASTGGGIYNSGTLTVSNSTVASNRAASGGGIYNSRTVTVSNSTFAGNAAEANFGDGGGILNFGTLTVSNSTISGNAADLGGGIHNVGALTLNNSIVAAQNGGGNIVGGYDGSNNLIDVDPGLGPLADNGGQTQTMALLPGSPAINVGSNALAVDSNGDPLTFDQRGTGFPRIVGGVVDIGAYEVQNSPPTVAADFASVAADEGSPAMNSGTFDDAEGNATVTLAASIGTITQDNALGTWSWSLPTDDGPAGPTTVTITATDAAGETATTSFTFTVNNVAPVITALSNSSANLCGNVAIQGHVMTVSAAFSDAGRLDTHTATIEWGDGTTSAGAVVESDGTGTVAASHAYLHGGFYTITVSVLDDDGDSHSMTTQTVIAGANVQNGVLLMIGTNAAEHVSVNLNGPPDARRFEVHGEFGGSDGDSDGDSDGGSDGDSDGEFDAAGVNEIQAIMCGGDDHVQIASNIQLPTLLDGGANNDRLNAGGGPSVLIGGDGDDMLIGGSGRDLLIGGYGADRLVGNSSDDVLVAGTTAFDSVYAALRSIMAEWNSAASNATRVAHLRGTQAGGLNGSNFLNGDDVAGGVGAQTVFDDNNVDHLTGSSGVDWFLANTQTDNSLVRDIITDLRAGETASDIDLNL